MSTSDLATPITAVVSLKKAVPSTWSLATKTSACPHLCTTAYTAKMMIVVGVVAAWAHDYKVSLHLGRGKTVMQIVALGASRAASSASAWPLYRPIDSFLPKRVLVVDSHGWLGLLWRTDGSWLHHAQWCVAVCSAMVDTLCSLISFHSSSSFYCSARFRNQS